jgi:hypothetical protein
LPEAPVPSSTPSSAGKPSDDPGRTKAGLQRRFVDILAWIIVGAWGSSFVLDAVVTTYDPPPVIHALMMVVAGAAFGSTFIHKGAEE